MLRNLLIVTTSGLVLFSKEYQNAVAQCASQPRLFGSLIRTIVEFSARAVGIPVCHIKLAGAAVTIVQDKQLFCIMFHDADDAPEFVKLVANRMVHAFVGTFGVDAGAVGRNLNDFRAFQYSVVEIIRDSLKPLLTQMHSKPCLSKAIVVYGPRTLYSIVAVDELAVLANLLGLAQAAAETMACVGDALRMVRLHAHDGTHTYVWSLPGATLILQGMGSKFQLEIMDPYLASRVQMIYQALQEAA